MQTWPSPRSRSRCPPNCGAAPNGDAKPRLTSATNVKPKNLLIAKNTSLANRRTENGNDGRQFSLAADQNWRPRKRDDYTRSRLLQSSFGGIQCIGNSLMP